MLIRFLATILTPVLNPILRRSKHTMLVVIRRKA
jgi:hypothetical protein